MERERKGERAELDGREVPEERGRRVQKRVNVLHVLTIAAARTRVRSNGPSGLLILFSRPSYDPRPAQTPGKGVRRDRRAEIAAGANAVTGSVEKLAPTKGILLVDDIVEFRYLMRILLANVTPCQVVGEAGNGEVAIELAQSLQPDVIVLDVNMPVMGGFEALPKLREVAPDARVIIYSSQSGLEEEARRLGAFRYLEKGGDPMLLTQAVREAIQPLPPQAA